MVNQSVLNEYYYYYHHHHILLCNGYGKGWSGQKEMVKAWQSEPLQHLDNNNEHDNFARPPLIKEEEE